MVTATNRASDAVEAALDGLPLRVERRTTPYGMRVVAHAPDAVYTLAPTWAGEGFPDDVRRAIAGYHRAGSAPEVPVVVARRMSPGGRALAQRLDVGWADEAGNARIVAAPALAVVREGAAAPSPPRAAAWSPAKAAVAEYVLTRYATGGDDRLPTVASIAASLGRSAGQVANALAFFDAAGWTRKEGSLRGPGAWRRMVDPGGLLGAWAAWHRTEPVVATGFGASFRDAVAFTKGRLGTLLPGGEWCVTGWAALDLVAPFTTGVPLLDVYVADEAYRRTVAGIAGKHLRPVDDGARLRLLRAPRHVVALADPAPALPVASPVRVYGDLLTLGARGEEAADHLREVRLGF